MSKAAILGDAAIEQTPPAVLPSPLEIPVTQQAERSPISLGPNDMLVVRHRRFAFRQFVTHHTQDNARDLGALLRISAGECELTDKRAKQSATSRSRSHPHSKK